MTLKKLSKSPDDDFTKQWNELVTTVKQLRKLRTDGKIILHWVGGVPCLALGDVNKVPQLNFILDESGSETVPAFGLMRPADVASRVTLGKVETKKPTNALCRRYEVNGSQPVVGGEAGKAQLGEVVELLYDSSATPTPGTIWGPKSGEWEAYEGRPGFRCIGIADASKKIMLAIRDTTTDFVSCRLSPAAAVGKGECYLNGGVTATLSKSRAEDELFNVETPKAQSDKWPPLIALHDSDSGDDFAGSWGNESVIALVSMVGSSGTNVLRQAIVGPIPPGSTSNTTSTSKKLYRGLPGFRVMQGHAQGDGEKVIVLRDTEAIGWAKVTAKWAAATSNSPYTYSVIARALTDRAATEVYDGSHANLPLIELEIGIPTPATTFYGDPNIQVDQIIPYKIDNGQLTNARTGCVAVGDHMDDKVGSIKMFNSASSLPPGWALCDGTNGTVDLRSRFIVGYDPRTGGSIPAYGDANYQGSGNTGGALTHTHTVVGTGTIDVTNGAKTIDASDHRPPYKVVVFIQRIS